MFGIQDAGRGEGGGGQQQHWKSCRCGGRVLYDGPTTATSRAYALRVLMLLWYHPIVG